jgi:tetratricopeptide (TPR) repeat protein
VTADRLRPAIGLALFLGTAALFAQTVGFDFLHFDDRRYVSENPWVARGLTGENVWWALTTFYFSNWHPLTWLSYMLDFELYGLDPGGFHATNVVLHAANVVLLFRVLCRATGRTAPAALAAVLFACHPLHVEVVAWIGQRKELLGTLFGLLAIDAYVGWARHAGPWRYALVATWMGLALMAKPMWVTLPVFLLLLDAWPLDRFGGGLRPRLLEKLPLALLSLVSCALTLAAQGRAMETGTELGLPARVANASVAIGRYLAKTVWPADLSVLYPHPYLAGGTPLAAWEIAGSVLLLASITAVCVALRSRRYLLIGWLWFLFGLLPVIGIVQVGWQGMADRYSYVPHIGLFVLVAWAGDDVVRRLRTHRPAGARLVAGLGVVLLCAFAARAVQQTREWHDTTTLYRASLAATPNSHLLRYNLGNRLLDRGEYADAIAQYERALQLHPDHEPTGTSLAWLLATSPDASWRDPARALALAQQVAEAQEFQDPNTLDTLAAAHAAGGDFEQAVAMARRAGTLAVQQGRPSLARSIAQHLRSYESGRAYVDTVRSGP